MKRVIINYFFEEDEMELVNHYKKLIKIAMISAAISLLIIL